jgi:hypothetical protein
MPEDLELRRDRELLGRQDSKAYQKKIERFAKIREGFRGQARRADDIMDYWAIYNCEIDGNNYYNGNSDLYVPIVHVGIEAIKTRMMGQLFPQSGRYVDVTSSDMELPRGVTALLEDYVRQTHLRTRHIAGLIRNGRIEGQYNLYVDWNRASRWVVSRETVRPRIVLPGMPQPIDALDAGPQEVEGIVIEEIRDQHPTVEVLHDTDVLIRPQTANSIDDALRQGGDVTIIRRWTKETLEDLLERKMVRRRATEELLEISTREDDEYWRRSEKELIDAAGIRLAEGGMKIFQVYETWQLEECDKEQRLTKTYYGGYDLVLSDRRNPMWNDRCQLISAPVAKQSGVAKGISPVKPVASLQYFANQIAQQAADSATYSMMPIVMTDPAKNPRTATMLLNVGALWEIDPQSTQFAQFPPIWKDGLELINSLSAQVMNALGVNPSMIPQSSNTGRSRQNQAEIAREQQVDIASGLEEAAVIEDDILSPMVTYWAEYDHQFRDEQVSVKTYGPAGQAANIEKVPLLQSTTRFHFSWFGVEQARNAAVQQQLTALMNVAMSPQMGQALAKNGKQIDPSSALETAFGRLIGWREARKIVVDISAKLAMDPEIENQMLADKFDVPISPLDDDQKHVPVHQQLLQHPDPVVRLYAQVHLKRHEIQLGMKNQAQMQAQGMGQPQPGGGAPQPPNPGGAAAGPRAMRGPNGMLHPDQMAAAGAAQMPRKM